MIDKERLKEMAENIFRVLAIRYATKMSPNDPPSSAGTIDTEEWEELIYLANRGLQAKNEPMCIDPDTGQITKLSEQHLLKLGKWARDIVKPKLEIMLDHLCDCRTKGPCSQMWFQDLAEEALKTMPRDIGV